MEDVSMMMVDSPAASHTQPHASAFLSTRLAQVTDQISFTPTAVTKKAIPRAWERVPSTAFLARHKSRKLWKRFRKSMELLRERAGPAAVSRIEEKEFENEINASANADYRRAVKRQRLDVDHCDDNNKQDAQLVRGRSFLETKWEFEIGRRRRKTVPLTQQQQQDAAQPFDSQETPRLVNELFEESIRLALPETEPYAAADVLSQDAEAVHDLDNAEGVRDGVNPTTGVAESEAAAEIAEIVARREPNLVRSALRMNSLDGEDVALLSEFLSRAQAKRIANAAMMSNKTEDCASPNSPMVRSRKALEELDKNSPSPQKSQISTSTKGTADKAAETSPTPILLPGHDNTTEDAAGEEPSPTTCRRSARAKPSKPGSQTQSKRPVVPNQIPVRRANGTEFVFLQRTEAQELALTTRKNTKRNKGNAMLPKQFLQIWNKQKRNDGGVSPQSQETTHSRPGCKQVSWRDDNLVEYAPDRQFESLESQSPDRKTGKSRTHNLPATPSKKVRRVNVTAPPLAAQSTNPIMKPLSLGTPIPKRKKLTPKAPSTGTDTVVSIKGRQQKDAKPQESALKKSSLVPKPAIQKASSIPKSKILLKAPTSTSTSTSISISTSASASVTASAGATPVAKRLRAKKLRAQV